MLISHRLALTMRQKVPAVQLCEHHHLFILFIITHPLTLSPLFCYYKYALLISHSLQSILVLKSLVRKAEKMKLHFTTVVVCSLILSFSLLEPATAGSRKLLVDLTGALSFFF